MDDLGAGPFFSQAFGDQSPVASIWRCLAAKQAANLFLKDAAFQRAGYTPLVHQGLKTSGVFAPIVVFSVVVYDVICWSQDGEMAILAVHQMRKKIGQIVFLGKARQLTIWAQAYIQHTLNPVVP
jgi:hypothetical protein